jgi:hypothetical protein
MADTSKGGTIYKKTMVGINAIRLLHVWMLSRIKQNGNELSGDHIIQNPKQVIIMAGAVH